MRWSILASALLTPIGAMAQETCTSSDAVCIPFVACIDSSGEFFRGTSLGRDAGPLQATSSAGTTCTGAWKRLPSGIGVADFTCDDGREGSAVYTWFEPESGTAVGDGAFEDGTIARFWSGNNLERYFREIDDSERARMACQPADMLLS